MRSRPTQTWQSLVRFGPRELAGAWRRYRRTPTPDLRNRLLEHYLPLVKYQCQWHCDRLPSEVDPDDVMSAAVEGLRRAVEQFDPARGVRFETYCACRVRGAILDYLRTVDWLPRAMRTCVNQLRRSRGELTSLLGRDPSDEELAESLGLTPEEFGNLSRLAGATGRVSLDAGGTDGEGGSLLESAALADRKAASPAAALHRQELRERLVRGLERQQRQVLILYYYEEMTMQEVGAALGLTTSRVSQVHGAAVAELRRQLADHKEELFSVV